MNLLTWGVMLSLVVLYWANLRGEAIRITPASLMVLASAVLFTLPACWAPSQGLPAALPRLAGIWGGVIVYFTLVQLPPGEKAIVRLFYLLAAAAIIENVLSLLGLWAPGVLPFPLNELGEKYHGYAPGIFQQLNVTASFLATGLAVLLFLLADSRRASLKHRAECLRLIGTGTGIISLSATLVLFHSRIGWLGGVSSILAVWALFCQPRFRLRTTCMRRILLLLLPCLGGVTGAMLLNQPVVASLVHASSSQQRWLTLEYTLRMIGQHPWRGWGLGMFEPAFQTFMAALPFDNPNREMMQHPHNETLFIWAEGGILALAGGLCLLCAWLQLFRSRKTLWQWAALLCTLPTLLHTQVEFPLYYSVPHFFALLLLMAASDTSSRTLPVRSALVRVPLVILALYGIVLSAQLFYASIMLGKFETSRLADNQSIQRLYVPWLMKPRYQRDLSLLHLNNFNQYGDIAELETFAGENGEWITLHMKEDAWSDQIAILLFLHQRKEAERVKARAHRLMPWDERFKP